ncbi:hypothetical protein ACVW0I_004939 [Bradyrhizobium sp. LM6.11]
MPAPCCGAEWQQDGAARAPRWEEYCREDHVDRDAAHRGILQRHLGARPHRHGHDRSRRNLLRRRRGRSADSRHLCRPPARPQSAAHRGDPSRHAEPADGTVLDRGRISRGLGDRHRAVGSVRQGLQSAGAPDARRPLPRQAAHLQHLRRHPICPLDQYQPGRQLESRCFQESLRGSRRLHAPRRCARGKPAGERHLRHEDLAVRSGGAREQGSLHHRPRR